MLQTYLAYLAFVALVLSCSLREDHCLASIMRWQPLVRLGAISYGVYLLHMLCFNVADRLWFGAPEDHWIGRLTIGFVLVVIAAEISFRTFESWFLNLKVRFERK
jgi:peptidoglycan/LPS O-acetylase OafA/YrhL